MQLIFQKLNFSMFKYLKFSRNTVTFHKQDHTTIETQKMSDNQNNKKVKRAKYFFIGTNTFERQVEKAGFKPGI